MSTEPGIESGSNDPHKQVHRTADCTDIIHTHFSRFMPHIDELRGQQVVPYLDKLTKAGYHPQTVDYPVCPPEGGLSRAQEVTVETPAAIYTFNLHEQQVHCDVEFRSGIGRIQWSESRAGFEFIIEDTRTVRRLTEQLQADDSVVTWTESPAEDRTDLIGGRVFFSSRTADPQEMISLAQPKTLLDSFCSSPLGSDLSERMTDLLDRMNPPD